jgi:hypothetical protein
MNENEIQFASIPSNAEIALMEREYDVIQNELREFDQELG